MKKITFIFSFLIVAMGFSQTVVRNYAFDAPSSVNTSPDQIESSVPSSEFIDVERIADASGQAAETTFAYNADGNGTGALELSGINDGDPAAGRNYLFRIRDFSIDFAGISDLEVAFDIKRVGEFGPDTTLFFDFFVPQVVGVEVITEPDVHVGLTESYQTIVVPLNTADFDNNRQDFFIDIRIGASAVVGSGGTILIDNIIVRSQVASGPTCNDGMMNGDETGVDCGGPDCDPCPAADPTTDAPVPTNDPSNVLSVYSNTYGFDVTNFNFNDFNGGGTIEEVDIEGNGNTAGRIENYAFYGARWDAVDASSYSFLHVDYYATNASTFEFYMIDNSLANDAPVICCGNPQEPRYTVALSGGDETLVRGEWKSVVIPMTQFTNYGPLVDDVFDGTDIVQWKFVGDGELYFDNIFFSTDGLSVNEFAASDFKVFPNPTKGDWNIKANQNINSIAVFDILGKRVLALEPKSDSTVIPTNSLNNGVYFAKVQSELGSKTIKLIKN